MKEFEAVEARKIFRYNFGFFWLSGFQMYFIMLYENALPCQHVRPIRFSPKKTFGKYR
jgi:hypothetical protein